jgi:hypothetical protein
LRKSPDDVSHDLEIAEQRTYNSTVHPMSVPPVLIAAAALCVIGGCLAFFESVVRKRVVSIVSAFVTLASIGAFIRLVHVYNSRPLSVVIATRNPLAGLGPWDLMALVFSVVTIVGSFLGSRKALLPLLASGVLMLGYTSLVVSLWD